MRYKLRTLPILLAVWPPMLAWLIQPTREAYQQWRAAKIVRSGIDFRPFPVSRTGPVLIPDDN